MYLKDCTAERQSISVMRITREKFMVRWTDAGSIVTKDIPDNAVAVGNQARVVKMIEKK